LLIANNQITDVSPLKDLAWLTTVVLDETVKDKDLLTHLIQHEGPPIGNGFPAGWTGNGTTVTTSLSHGIRD